MKLYNYIFFIVGLITLGSCGNDFLDEEPFGEVDSSQIGTEDNLERLIISAYSILNGQMDDGTNAYNSPASNWSFGDVVSDDCYKGGGGTGDQNQIHRMEIYATDASIFDVERKWLALFEGVKRANLAIRLLNESQDFNPSLKETRLGELHFLRGHFYFELKKIYNQIPYVDETAITATDYARSNTEFTSEEIWAKIENDFSTAFDKLPATQEQIGRASKWAAKAYLAKTYLFQNKWQAAFDAAGEVINSGQYDLMADYQELFLPENDNNSEIIFAVQNSVNDGEARNFNGSIGDRLMPPGGPYPQYGFQRPSQDLVNAFKTDANGLPVPETSDLTNADNIDLRLDITVGRPNIPYKDIGVLYEESWARDLATYGPYGPKKRVVSTNSPYYTTTWPYTTALNFYIIRYAEVLLWRAEAAVELNQFDEARALINQLRTRVNNTQPIFKLDNSNTMAANYKIGTYNTSWTDKTAARNAVRLESRLELALEGRRFFNLVRWGVAASVLNEYVNEEKTIRGFLSNAQFTEGKNEYFPIPQKYIDTVEPDVEVAQNPNY